ncbi:hypothetical protein K6119_14520 [Paracrocinitomix mangrovi]|uniref:hypothetical protein n=1 Tax=Paracrocinitomix mangrovi TaxID=2862509 RepID=UPI001C8EC69B|nr:hypothetical protein [Paracrocinitomix mangrovi]UKN00946.1 hypothetical protein K6119_14520 [Paracrocinitomix mangrovi]
MKTSNFLLAFFSFFGIWTNAQSADMKLHPSIVSPQSGCGLSTNESITVFIVNVSTVPFTDTVVFGYSLDGGSAHYESVNITYMGPNTNYFHSFMGGIDLSACQEHDLKIWAKAQYDPNATNDTVNVIIQSDCPPIAGAIVGPSDLCIENQDSLFVSNYNGSISHWETSVDGGNNWNTVASTNSYFELSGIINPTLIHAVTISQYGYCPGVNSNDHSINTVHIPISSIAPDAQIYEGDTIQLDVTGGVSQVWSPNYNIDNIAIADPLVWPAIDTTYVVTVTDAYGCVQSADVHVDVFPATSVTAPENEVSIVIPTLIDKNVFWQIQHLGDFPQHLLNIYDINGKLLYTSTSYKQNWSFNNAGLYLYTLELNDGNFREPLTGKIVVR